MLKVPANELELDAERDRDPVGVVAEVHELLNTRTFPRVLGLHAQGTISISFHGYPPGEIFVVHQMTTIKKTSRKALKFLDAPS